MYISKANKGPRWLYIGLLVLEFCLTLPGLVLTALASPDTYRTDLWEDGSLNGFNSSPKARLYALANYRSYTTPLVWSQFITNWNLIIFVLSVLALLVKSFLFIVDGLWPILSIPAHMALVAIFAYSVYGQAGPDTTDPDHMQKGAPWYITKSCSVAALKTDVGPCMQAKAIFGISVTMLSIFLIFLGFALYSAVPTKAQRITHKDKRRLAREKAAALADSEAQMRYNKFHSQWGHNPYAVNGYAEGQQQPFTPGTTGGIKSPAFPSYAGGYPAETPRTLAFNTLGGMASPPHANFQQQQQTPQQGAMQSPPLMAQSPPNSPPSQQQQQLQDPSSSSSPPPPSQQQHQPYPYPYLNHTYPSQPQLQQQAPSSPPPPSQPSYSPPQPSQAYSPPQPSTSSASRDLPLRNHFSTPQPPSSPTGRRSISAASGSGSAQGGNGNGGPDGYAPMYFPPPPKKAVK